MVSEPSKQVFLCIWTKIRKKVKNLMWFKVFGDNILLLLCLGCTKSNLYYTEATQQTIVHWGMPKLKRQNKDTGDEVTFLSRANPWKRTKVASNWYHFIHLLQDVISRIRPYQNYHRGYSVDANRKSNPKIFEILFLQKFIQLHAPTLQGCNYLPLN